MTAGRTTHAQRCDPKLKIQTQKTPKTIFICLYIYTYIYTYVTKIFKEKKGINLRTGKHTWEELDEES